MTLSAWWLHRYSVTTNLQRSQLLVASVCSLGAIYFRIDNTRQILHHYRHGVKQIKLSKDILEKVQELETFLNDKIDPPEYLLDKYGRRKAQAYRTLLVGVLEDIPQFVFNIAKASSTVVTMVSISLSAVSFGYKLSMPYVVRSLTLQLYWYFSNITYPFP